MGRNNSSWVHIPIRVLGRILASGR
jgi:hypothetical protein